MSALGIDVGVRKGLDLVLIDDDRVLDCARRVRVDELAGWIEAWRPVAIGVDSPRVFGTNGPRATGVAVRRLGIRLYATPWQPQKIASAFYDWMRVGHAVFQVCAQAGYALFDGARARGAVMEVFPHACAVVLHGRLRPAGVRKEAWRRDALRRAGMDDGRLRGIDQVDAALAALAARRALEGLFIAPGDPSEGVIVLPCQASDLPASFRA